MEDLIQNYNNCPVCKAKERAPVTRRPYYDRYMKVLSEKLNLDFPKLLDTLKTFQCDNCESIYSDPWLNSKGMYALYGKGHPQHILGWEIFYNWVNQPTASNSNHSRASLWRLFEKIVGPVNNFGQLNCPFFGPLLYFNDLQFGDPNKVDRVAEAMSSITSTYLHPYQAVKFPNQLANFFDKRVRFKKVVKDQHNIDNVNQLSKTGFKHLIQQDSLAEEQKEDNALEKPIYGIPDNRFLVFEPSSCFWSTNCNSLNCSCRSISGELLNTPVIDIKDVKREGIKFDLFCIFNALDHYLDPKELIAELLEVSKVVFIDTHQSDEKRSFSRQHFYVFGKNFLDKIAEPDWSWIDITDQADLKFQNSYMISKEVDLNKILKNL